jgi:bifunctional DNA-binding transcriptional regulator/antitoxin component of YhaV-PrlF toxin-antitoxin module
LPIDFGDTMPERKVNQIGGHSYSLTIPKEICKKVGITEKTVLAVELIDGKITLTKVK